MTCKGCKGQGSPRPRTQKVISKDSSSIVNLHSTSSQTYPRSSSMFLKDFLAKSSTAHEEDTPQDESNEDEGVLPNVEAPAFTGYESDLLDYEPVEVVVDRVVHNEQESEEARGEFLNNDESSGELNETIQLAWLCDCQEVTTCEQCRRSKENHCRIQETALKDIESLIKSQKVEFKLGVHSLQAYCALAIQSYFWMVVHNGQKGIEASVIAAESHGFAKNWGGRLVCHWVWSWLQNHKLPLSERG